MKLSSAVSFFKDRKMIHTPLDDIDSPRIAQSKTASMFQKTIGSEEYVRRWEDKGYLEYARQQHLSFSLIWDRQPWRNRDERRGDKRGDATRRRRKLSLAVRDDGSGWLGDIDTKTRYLGQDYRSTRN
jgi:hypothetical protein